MKIKKLSDEEVKELARPGFIIDDIDNDEIDETLADEESDEEDALFDSVCWICDNGGSILWNESCFEFLLQVFKCASATCGFFYHPECVTKILKLVVKDAPEELLSNIAKGEPFTCPAHYCRIRKEMENKNKHELHFAVCRRCPKSYHRK